MRAAAPDFTAASRVKTGIGCLSVYTPLAVVGAWLLLRIDKDLWLFALLLLLGIAPIVARLRYVRRMRHLADPVAEIEDGSALVRLTTPVPLRRFAIELECDGVRSTLYEANDVSGAISQRVDVEEDCRLIVVQTTEAGEVETAFDIP